MTLNFDELYASTRDYAILDRNPPTSRTIVGVFDDDWAGQHDTRRRLARGTSSGRPGRRTDVLGLIEHARHSIDLEDEEMAYAPAIAALCADARRGVDVRLVMTYDSDWRRRVRAIARLRSVAAALPRPVATTSTPSC